MTLIGQGNTRPVSPVWWGLALAFNGTQMQIIPSTSIGNQAEDIICWSAEHRKWNSKDRHKHASLVPAATHRYSWPLIDIQGCTLISQAMYQSLWMHKSISVAVHQFPRWCINLRGRASISMDTNWSLQMHINHPGRPLISAAVHRSQWRHIDLPSHTLIAIAMNGSPRPHTNRKTGRQISWGKK